MAPGYVTTGMDDDPDFYPYVEWAAVCFGFTFLGLILIYCTCNHCKEISPESVSCGPVPMCEVVCCCNEKPDQEKKASA
ncbi:hypothetical protein M885DRAFT_618366 [Pelagophyceae sp. CCMP2097]|nr:hypothetical protein M885DRAFT_618366 [Pelagophyceae sp. CCMP2097]